MQDAQQLGRRLIENVERAQALSAHIPGAAFPAPACAFAQSVGYSGPDEAAAIRSGWARRLPAPRGVGRGDTRPVGERRR